MKKLILTLCALAVVANAQACVTYNPASQTYTIDPSGSVGKEGKKQSKKSKKDSRKSKSKGK